MAVYMNSPTSRDEVQQLTSKRNLVYEYAVYSKHHRQIWSMPLIKVLALASSVVLPAGVDLAHTDHYAAKVASGTLEVVMIVSLELNLNGSQRKGNGSEIASIALLRSWSPSLCPWGHV